MLRTLCKLTGILLLVDGSPQVNDPLYKEQKPYLEAINIPGAWKRLWSTKARRVRVTVAVIDSGVQPNHPDLIDNIIKGYNVVDRNDDTHDRKRHGTEMAGIIGAAINNSIGLAGAMDLVNIMPIFDGVTPDVRWTTAAVDYVIRKQREKNIKIILMATTYKKDFALLSAKIKEASEAGILVVVPTGNDGMNINVKKRYPCALTEQLHGVLCVAATEMSEMKLMPESNFASYVDIAAPGRNIMTTAVNSNYSISH